MPPLLWLAIILLDVTCLFHVQRTGRPDYWFYLILFTFGVGAVAYLLFEILPEWAGSSKAAKLRGQIGKRIDPEQHYRSLKEIALDAPSIRNRAKLAVECTALGKWEEADKLYTSCLDESGGDDRDLLLGLAEAKLELGQPAQAVEALDRLQAAHPQFKSPPGHLLYARAMANLGDKEAANAEFEAVRSYFPGPEASCRFADWLADRGERAQASAIYKEAYARMERAPAHVRRLHNKWWEHLKKKAV